MMVVTMSFVNQATIYRTMFALHLPQVLLLQLHILPRVIEPQVLIAQMVPGLLKAQLSAEFAHQATTAQTRESFHRPDAIQVNTKLVVI